MFDLVTIIVFDGLAGYMAANVASNIKANNSKPTQVIIMLDKSIGKPLNTHVPKKAYMMKSMKTPISKEGSMTKPSNTHVTQGGSMIKPINTPVFQGDSMVKPINTPVSQGVSMIKPSNTPVPQGGSMIKPINTPVPQGGSFIKTQSRPTPTIPVNSVETDSQMFSGFIKSIGKYLGPDDHVKVGKELFWHDAFYPENKKVSQRRITKYYGCKNKNNTLMERMGLCRIMDKWGDFHGYLSEHFCYSRFKYRSDYDTILMDQQLNVKYNVLFKVYHTLVCYWQFDKKTFYKRKLL